MIGVILDLVARGWYVFPIQQPKSGDRETGKRPVGSLVPNGLLDATRDEATIREWWAKGDWNVGVACAPSGLVCLDVDTSGVKQGMLSLREFDLPDTLSARTGSGGFHAIYARGDHAPMQSLGVRPGLDLIGKGYFVAAPSKHYSGGTYQWINDLPIAPLPEVLAKLVKVRPAQVDPTATVIQGDRNNSLFRLGCALRAQGLDGASLRVALASVSTTRFQPPLEQAEVDAVCASVLARVDPKRDASQPLLGDELDPQPVADCPDECTALELIPALRAQAALPVVPLQFPDLAQRLGGGLHVHSSTLIVAGTGKGKSSLAGQISAWHAANVGPVVYYVGEMTRVHVLARIVGQLLARSWLEVLEGKVSDYEIERSLAGRPIYFVARSGEPLKAVTRAVRRARADGHAGIPMIVIDYVQLLANTVDDMRVAMITAVRELQQFFEACPVVGLVLSQSSRSGSSLIRKGGENAEEFIGTGAETAELERACTNQLVLSFASKDGVEEHEVTIAIAKSRFGGGAKLGFTFNGRTGIWSPLAKTPHNEEHSALCAEVLAQVEIHDARKCTGGVSCGRDLTAFSLGRGTHKVNGRTNEITKAIQDLIELGKVVKVGNALHLK